MKKIKSCKHSEKTIVFNKYICYQYYIEEKLEGGIILQGWEVKTLYAKKANIKNSYITIKDSEAFLLGANFIPLTTTSTHHICNPTRTRKLLLNRHEIDLLYGCIYQNGYTAVALSLYWKKRWCKIQIGIVKGKKQHDKRYTLKNREWQRHKARILKRSVH